MNETGQWLLALSYIIVPIWTGIIGGTYYVVEELVRDKKKLRMLPGLAAIIIGGMSILITFVILANIFF